MKHPSFARSSRRLFLKRSTLGVLATWTAPSLVPQNIVRAANGATPSNRLTVASIGVGPRGTGVMRGFLNAPGTQVLAVCDVKRDQLLKARNLVNQHYQNQDCYTHHDFRELVARRDIDIITVGTPDHWHVLVALAAVRAGKHVYVEKPLGLSLAEDQALRTALQQHHCLFQFGTQQRSGSNFRRACEIVRNGRIGSLKHIKVWSVASVPGGSTEPEPVPPGFDYDFWLGPAPFKPHCKDLCSADGMKKTWWFRSEYALGFIAGWGIHPIDIAAWGYPGMFNGPIRVTGTGTIPTSGACDTATAWKVDYQFDSGVTLDFRGIPISANGGPPIQNARLWQERYGRTIDHGTAFEGTGGWVHVDRSGIHANPETLLDENPRDYPIRLIQSSNHAVDLLDAIRQQRNTVAPIEDAIKSDSLCHVADATIRLGKTLTWLPEIEQFQDDDTANKRLAARSMRQPWHL